MSRTITVPKIGDGSIDDPYRPNVDVDTKIAELKSLLNLYKEVKGKELTNKTFFCAKVLKDLDTEYEVLILEKPDIEAERTVLGWIRWLKKQLGL